MRVSPVVVVAAVAVALGLVAGRASAVQDSAPKAAPAFVAVVDVSRVLQGIKRSQDLVDQVKKEGDALRAMLTAREEDLKKRHADLLQKLQPGTPEHSAELRKLELERRGIEFDLEQGRADLERRKVKGLARLYREVCAEAERIADERGYTALLQMDGEPIADEDEAGRVLGGNDLKLQMALRGVLWTRKDNDISAAVVEALNK